MSNPSTAERRNQGKSRGTLHTLHGILSRSGRLIVHQGLFVCLTRRDALQILYGCIRKFYPSAHSRHQACGEKDVRTRKGLAKDERPAGCQHLTDNLRLFFQLLSRRQDSIRCFPIDCFEIGMLTKNIERVGIELHHQKKTPLVIVGPSFRIGERDQAALGTVSIPYVCDDGGAFRKRKFSVLQYWNLLTRINTGEFFGFCLAGSRSDRPSLVFEAHLLQNPMRPHRSRCASSPKNSTRCRGPFEHNHLRSFKSTNHSV